MTSPRIERGMALLDERRPGWENEIDLDTLDLSSSCNCVLGQLDRRDHPRNRAYDPFTRMRTALGLRVWPSEYGFVTYRRELYDNLTEKWRRAILGRRGQ